MHAALLERVFYVKTDGVYARPILPTPGAILKHLGPVRKRIVRMSSGFQPISSEEFLDSYKGPKRKSYERASASLSTTPLSTKDYVVKAFVKDEKMDEGKVPRVIRPMNQRVNLSLGRYIKPGEKVLYGILNRLCRKAGGTSVSVTKGLNCYQVADLIVKKWGRFKNPLVLILDCARFDQHNSIAIMQWARSVIVESSHLDPANKAELTFLLDKQLRTTTWANCNDGDIKVKCEGTLCSGVMNTSLYGILITFCIIYSYAQTHTGQFDILCAGDDTNLFVEEDEYEHVQATIQAYAAQFGFKLKIEGTASSVETVTFCRMRPVFDGTLWRMVRDPEDSLARDCLTTKSLSCLREYDYQRTAVADCGLSLTTGIPVLQAFYEMLRRGTTVNPPKDRHLTTGMQFMARGLTGTGGVTITTEARVSFWRAFGIEPDYQEHLERQYSTLSPSYANRCDLNDPTNYFKSTALPSYL